MSEDTRIATTTDQAKPLTLSTPPRGQEIRHALAVLNEAKEFGEMLANSQFIPQAFRGKPGDIMACLLLGQSVGLGPMQALQGIAVINGRPSLWGDAALSVVRSHPDFVDIEERLDAGKDSPDAYVAVCIVKRRGQTPTERRFSVADAQKGQLWGKQGPWSQYPKRMLQMRARGFAIRDAFSDALTGMMLREEAEDFIDVTPAHAPEMAPDAPEGRRMRIGGAKPNGGAPTVDAGTIDARSKSMVELDTRSIQAHADKIAAEAKEAEPPKPAPAPEKKEAEQHYAADAHKDWPVPPCPDCNSTEHVRRTVKASKFGNLECLAEKHGADGRRFFRASDAEIEAVSARIVALDADTLGTVQVAMQAEGVPGDTKAWAFEHVETARAILDDEAKRKASLLPATGGQPGTLA